MFIWIEARTNTIYKGPFIVRVHVFENLNNYIKLRSQTCVLP